MGHLQTERTGIAGLMILKKSKLTDERGHLSRLFCADELRDQKLEFTVKQINHTSTLKKGAVRGLHFQRRPFSEAKIVNCIRGKIFDVAVDLRPDSPTFLKWEARILSDQNWDSFYIPDGFAHGFQTLSDDVEMIYFHSANYSPQYEAGINPMDKRLAIEWPLEVSQMSDKDANLPMIEELESSPF